MTTIYLVNNGEWYADYSVDALYSTRELAEAHVALYGGDIEEWELDRHRAAVEGEKRIWYVEMNQRGDVKRCLESSFLNGGQSWDKRRLWLRAYVFASDEREAVAIVDQRRQQLIDAGKWGDPTAFD